MNQTQKEIPFKMYPKDTYESFCKAVNIVFGEMGIKDRPIVRMKFLLYAIQGIVRNSGQMDSTKAYFKFHQSPTQVEEIDVGNGDASYTAFEADVSL